MWFVLQRLGLGNWDETGRERVNTKRQHREDGPKSEAGGWTLTAFEGDDGILFMKCWPSASDV
jgi:hypothetical protein